MKKLLLPLLLLLAVGMLLAVESAPSEVVGYVKYDCVAGLNLVALPMEQGYTTSSEFGDQYPGMMDAINYWDASTQTWASSLYYGDPDFVWDPELEIGPGTVYMVNVVTPFSMYSIGSLPAANAAYALTVGLNTIMLPLNKAALNTTSLLGDDIGNLDAINSWDASTQTWVSALYYGDPDFVWDPEYPTSIGNAFMVSSIGVTTWPSGARNVNNFKLKTK